MEEGGTKSNTYLVAILVGVIALLMWAAQPSRVQRDIQDGNGVYCEYIISNDELLCDGEYYASTKHVTPERLESDKRIKEAGF